MFDLEKLVEARKLLSEVSSSTKKRAEEAPAGGWDRFELDYVSHKLHKDIDGYLEYYEKLLEKHPQVEIVKPSEEDQIPVASKS